MTGIELTQLAVLTAFAVNSLLLTGLIALKEVHRRRHTKQARRRSQYVTLLTRHLAHDNCTDPITDAMTEDPAFLDALIDVRNTLTGPEVHGLRGIVHRYGVAARQAARLRRRFPLGSRLRAAVALAEMGDESSAPVLMEHLDDREPEVRIQCARGLGRIRWTPAIDAIMERFGTETPWVRTRFADALVGFGSKATWPLLAFVRVNHRHQGGPAAMAIRTLGVIGDDQATEPLLEILEKATDPEVSIAAVEALGIQGNPLAVRGVLAAFTSEDWRVRAKAATALGEIGDASSVSSLAAGLGDRSWWVRRNSAAALAKIPEGVDDLHAALRGPDRFAADAAAEALADAGELEAARSRFELGQATARDQALLRHMAGDLRVTA